MRNDDGRTRIAPRQFKPDLPGRLNGIDSVPVPSDATIIFSHENPHLASRPLVIRSGANAIKWAYHLNTQVTSTYGGEVVQILSCNVGPLSIEGMPMGSYDHAGKPDHTQTPYDEMARIKDWFFTYMHLAGTSSRDERGVLFTYPLRGWSFRIQVTQLNGFKVSRDVVSPTWQIVAEIISDNDLNYFSGQTMHSFTDTITKRDLVQIGFNPNSKWINPAAAENAARDLASFGDNFQNLLGAWSNGDFAHFGFNQLNGVGENKLNKDSREYWTNIFGTDFINLAGPSGADATGGPSNYTGNPNSTAQSDIVAQIASVFEAAGIPGDIGVATAITESHLSPDARQEPGGHYMGLFQTLPSTVGGNYHKTELTEALQNRDQKVTKYYPVGLQIGDAAQWFAAALKIYDQPITAKSDDATKALFAKAAQGAVGPNNVSYAPTIESNLPKARALIKQYASSGGPGTVATGDTASLATQLLAQLGTKWIDQSDSAAHSGKIQLQKVAAGQLLQSPLGKQVPLDPRTIQIILYLISAGFTIGTSAWCEDHNSNDGYTGHQGGFAVDIASINGIAISGGDAGPYTLEVARRINKLTGVLAPRQIITGGYGRNRDPVLTALSRPQPADIVYGADTMQRHTDHIHVGY